MCKILSIDTEAESDYKVPVNPSDLTVLEALAFGYDVTWPISLILNRKALACYQMLFRHLLYCKHVEKMLSNVWLATKVPHRETLFTWSNHSQNVYDINFAQTDSKRKMSLFLTAIYIFTIIYINVISVLNWRFVAQFNQNFLSAFQGLKSFSSEYVTSFALKQKMLHFMQNLEYHMTFEVLEPNWMEMIAKIQSGKVSNVDQVNKLIIMFIIYILLT